MSTDDEIREIIAGCLQGENTIALVERARLAADYSELLELRERVRKLEPAKDYTTGHCEAAKANGGVCPHHNLQCGWPECDRRPTHPARTAP